LLVLPWVTHSLVQPTERILPHTHLLVRSNRSKPHHLPHTYNACGSTMQENDRGRLCAGSTHLGHCQWSQVWSHSGHRYGGYECTRAPVSCPSCWLLSRSA
jgi:hypothetical protein